ncbi:MAG: UDP-3-O-(3-hydroxymyristoyl)glucosamine N-acyltransferase [Candidatus Margulisbacteria bacterium]|nr:UDP-3-O-(3-hydroxymyristoyl)glucosamine N-acyltransferase [Candidatus Margulisiibacteriota bacterium]
MKLKDLAKVVSGKLVGDENLEISGVAPIEEARNKDLVFVLDSKFLASALKSGAAALVAPADSKIKGKAALLVANPRLALAQILHRFAPKNQFIKGKHKTAVVADSTKIGKRVTIYPFVFIGENCEIGDDTIIYPSATIHDRVKIGRRVIVHSGARIGVDGYGYVQQGSHHIKIPQIGNVIIEDDVEIYANVCISRATIGSTIIGSGTKIDNLSHVAHNCKIGKDCAIVSLVGFAGSVTLKDHVYVAGQAGFNGHITVGENTVVMAKAGVTKDIPDNSVVSGFPAIDHKKDLEIQAILRKLPELYQKLK